MAWEVDGVSLLTAYPVVLLVGLGGPLRRFELWRFLTVFGVDGAPAHLRDQPGS